MAETENKDDGANRSVTKQLTPEAKRALEEAEARRKDAAKSDQANELGGRNGPDPTRYGDWEKNGILSDF